MKTVSLSKSRYSGLAGLLENAPVLAALQACYRQYGQPAEAFGLNAEALSYIDSCCECALSDIAELLETFSRIYNDWQQSDKPLNVEARTAARAMTTLTALCGGLLPEIVGIQACIHTASRHLGGDA